MRVPIVGGNWKMNTREASARSLAEQVAEASAGHAPAEVCVFPPFPYLIPVREALGDSGVRLGAQDLYFEPDGAFTGEVSAGMLDDLGAAMVLCGHSERRHVIGEGDQLVNRKLHAAVDAGLVAMLCIGETLQQREDGHTDRVNEHQLRAGLRGVGPEQAASLVIAYEPVWAIGTGRNASPQDAQAAHEAIRAVLADLLDDDAAAEIRVIYGGSIKPDNAADIFAQPDVDGGLVGGASLDASGFGSIVAAAALSVS